MRFIVDESTGAAVVDYLRSSGHYVLAVAEIMRQADDPDILTVAMNAPFSFVSVKITVPSIPPATLRVTHPPGGVGATTGQRLCHPRVDWGLWRSYLRVAFVDDVRPRKVLQSQVRPTVSPVRARIQVSAWALRTHALRNCFQINIRNDWNRQVQMQA